MSQTTKEYVIKFAIILALATVFGATIYFAQEYSLGKSLQLATLLGLGALIGSSIVLYVAGIFIDPFISKSVGFAKQNTSQDTNQIDERLIIPKEERIVRHASKEEFIEKTNRLSEIEQAHQKLQEMAREIGAHEEVILLLSYDLSFLLTKEALQGLLFGKITEENSETGTLEADSGFWFMKQHIRVSIHAITNNTTTVYIRSRSSSDSKSREKDIQVIQKIVNSMKEKEQFYLG